MQTTIANVKTADTARPATKTGMQTRGNAFIQMLARKWDMIGVAAVMGASATYAAAQLMTLAR